MLVPAAAVAMVVGLGAAQRPVPSVAPGEPDPNKGAQKSEKAKSASPKAEPSGIPECDKYFAMADACIATKKMSKEDQQATEFNVNRLRTMLPIARAPQGRATLVERCTKSIELAQKDDKYGCYKPEKK
jgi:hypothetical protein